MNLKTTLALVVLAACAAGLVYTQGQLPSRLDPWRQQTVSAPNDGSRAILEAMTADSLNKIEIRRGSETTVIERGKDGSWVMPGNWPTRAGEVNKLVEMLTSLRSRFDTEPMAAERDVKRFGLDKPAVTVVVATKDGKHTLAFSDKSADGDGSRFDRPTFVRVDDKEEVLRLGPGVVAVLDRPSDYYLQRRLFPSVRVPREEGSPSRVERLAAKRLVVEEPGKSRFAIEGKYNKPRWTYRPLDAFTLKRLEQAGLKGGSPAEVDPKPEDAKRWLDHARAAMPPRPPESWELAEPYRDALDPATRDRLLEAVAELWAEKFLDGDKAKDDITGLNAPERTLAVTREDGSLITLHIGKPSGPPPPPALPGMPAPPRGKNYARLAGFNRVFEVNSDKLNSIFVPIDTLRDSQLARFTPADAREVELTTSKGTVVLRNESKPREGPSDAPPPPSDWRIVQPIKAKADSAVVDKLLSALSSASAVEKDIAEKARLGGAVGTVTLVSRNVLSALALAFLTNPAREYGLEQPAASIKVNVEEGKRDNQPKTKKSFVVRLGRHDKTAKKLYAMSQDWPRISEIGDELADVVLDKSALDYRGKRLLDFRAAEVKQVQVRRSEVPGIGAAVGLMGSPAVLSRLGISATLTDRSSSLTLVRTPSGWELSEPVKADADAGLVNDVADKLSKLDVVAWVADSVKPDEAQAKYGLGTPAVTVTLAFKDAKTPARTLLVGKMREGNPPSYFAKLADAPEVFALSEDIYQSLSRDSLGYRPSNLWTVAPGDEITKFRIARAGQDEYTLQRKGDDWEVSGPFSVKAPKAVIDQLVKTLSSPTSQGYKAHSATDYASFGLNTPPIKVTITTKQNKEHTLWIGSPQIEGLPVRFARLGDKGAAVFLVGGSLVSAADQSALDFLDRDLLKFNAEAAISFAAVKGADVLELVKEDETWKLKKPAALDADERTVGELFKALSELKADRIAAYKPKDLTPFGLDKPAATLTIKLAGDAKPNEYVLELGGEVKDKPGKRYAALKGGPMVAELSADAVKKLLAGTLTYRDHAVARLPEADSIKLEAGDRKLTFSNPEGTWKITQPAALEADHDALSNFVNALARLRADEFAAEKPNAEQLKAFGLDKPAMHWQFLSGEQMKLDLLIGGTEKGGPRRHAMLKGGDLVFLLDAKLSALAVGEYRPRTIFKDNIDPAQIESVKFGHKANPFELKKVDDAWQVVGKADARVDTKALTDTLAVLRDLKADRFIKDDKAELKLYGLDPAELVLEVKNAGGTYTLHLGGREGDTKKRYARVPIEGRSDVFLLDESASTKLFRDLAALTMKE